MPDIIDFAGCVSGERLSPSSRVPMIAGISKLSPTSDKISGTKSQGQNNLVFPVFGGRNIRHTLSTKPTEKPNGFALFRLAHPGAVPPAPTFAGRRLVRGGYHLGKTGIFLKAHYSCNMQAAEQKMLSRIYRRGWDGAFRKPDVVDGFDEADIRWTLSDLARAGKIRCVCCGVCDYPRHDVLPGQALSPDIDQMARHTAALHMTMKSMDRKI